VALSGILRIDQLFEGQSLEPIGPEDPDLEAVGVIQDLLIGHGFKGLPGLLHPARGRFGHVTTQAVRTFRASHDLPDSDVVDRATLEKLVTTPASRPLAGRGYLTLALDFKFSGMTRLMSLTTQFESAGLFAALNLNTDRAGLSFGLIQWAQKPGRLNEILRAFQTAQPQLFAQVFGQGDATLAQALMDHTAKPGGGVDNQGRTIDPGFDLVQEPWASRFHEAGLSRDFQRVQVETALTDFRTSFQKLQAFAPQIQCERGVAFMLDLANQHGDGGAKSIFKKVQEPGLSEADLMTAMEQESVARVRKQFGEGPEVESTRNRRDAFRTSPILSDSPFTPT
jgi:hypothetical protein